MPKPIFARTLLLTLASVALAGCRSIPPAPIEPHDLHDRWLAFDARAATDAVTAALDPDRVHDGTTPADFDLEDGITLAEAVVTALFFHPELMRLRASLDVSVATADRAGAWEDPELSIDGDQVLESVPDRLTWGGTLAVTIPLSGRPALERDLARARLDAASATIIGAEWAVVAELRLQWLRLATIDARIRLLEDAIEDLDRLVDATGPLRAARAMSSIEERILRLGRARAIEERLDASAARDDLRLRIIAFLGLHPRHPWALEATFPEAGASAHRSHDLPEFEALHDHPDLAIALASYTVAERVLALEQRKRIPDLTIGIGAGREDGESQLLFGLGLLPIPLWNRNAEGIATAHAERTAAEIEVASVIRDLVGRRAIEHAHYHAAEERLTYLEEEVAPLADAQLQDARRLAVLGSLDPQQLIDAIEEQRRIRLELLSARSAALAAEITLDALTAPCETHTTLEVHVDPAPSPDVQEEPR